MIQRFECGVDVIDGEDTGRHLPLDHHDLDAQRPRCRDFSIGCAAATVLADDDIDAVFDQKGVFVRLVEWPGCQDVLAIGHRERRIDGIDAAHQIEVLRRAAELVGLLSADGEKDAPWRRAQRSDGRFDIGDRNPVVTVLPRPIRTAEREDRHTGESRGIGSIGGNLVGERMRRIDDQRNILLSDIVCEAVRAAKTTDARFDGQRAGMYRSSGQRNDRMIVVAARQPLGQLSRFGGAAEYQDSGSLHV